MLDDAKKPQRKKRRIELKTESTRDAQRRKKWSQRNTAMIPTGTWMTRILRHSHEYQKM